MRFRSFLLPISMSFCIAALAVLVWRQHSELKQMQSQMIALSAESLRASQAVPGSADSGRVRETALPADERHLVEAAGAEPRRSLDEQRSMGVAHLMENPQFIRALVSHQRALLDDQFGPLFSRLKLAENELETLRALLIEKQNAALDIMMVAKQGMIDRNADNEVQAATLRAQAEIDGMIRSTLGEERYAVFREFETSLPQRATVDRLAQRLSYTETPLAADQSEALLGLLEDGSGGITESFPGVSVVISPDSQAAVPIVHSSTGESRITDEVVVQASDILNQEQLSALREIQREQSASSTMVRLTRSFMPSSSASMLGGFNGLEVQLLLQ